MVLQWLITQGQKTMEAPVLLIVGFGILRERNNLILNADDKEDIYCLDFDIEKSDDLERRKIEE